MGEAPFVDRYDDANKKNIVNYTRNDSIYTRVFEAKIYSRHLLVYTFSVEISGNSMRQIQLHVPFIKTFTAYFP